jgi:hypothetical protein
MDVYYEIATKWKKARKCEDLEDWKGFIMSSFYSAMYICWPCDTSYTQRAAILYFSPCVLYTLIFLVPVFQINI